MTTATGAAPAADPAPAGGAPAGGAAPNPGAGGIPGGAAPAGGNPAPAATGTGATAAAAAAQAATAEVWGQDWRQKYAGEDKGKLSTLERYATPKDALDSMFTARAEIQRLMGQVPPGKDATPEQKAAYRTAQGVPEKAEGYFDKLDKGIVFGALDKPVVMQYLAKAHERGDSPAAVAENLKIYHDANVAMVQQMQQNDAAAKTSFDTSMRESLGAEYDENMGRFKALVESVPADLKAHLMNARSGDDKATPLMLNPSFAKWMIDMARQVNPLNTAMPPGGLQTMSAVEDQLKAYEKRMGTKEWHRDEKSQAQYRNLVTHWEKNNPGKQWGR